MIDGCSSRISKAMNFLENKTEAEGEVWSCILAHAGEMTQKEISGKFGLSLKEFNQIMERLFEIRFILEEDEKIFPTIFAGVMIEAYERLEKYYEL